MLALYLRDVVPFRMMIDPDGFPKNGLLFADDDGEPWDTTVLTDTLTKETERRIGYRMTWQDYRHISKAIDRKFIRVPGSNVEEDDEGLDEDEEQSNAVHDLMQAHSVSIATKHYARMTDLLKNMSPESIDIFREVSDKWQRWLGLLPRQLRDDRPDVEDEDLAEEEPLEDRLAKVMYDLFGASWSWRSPEQERAVMSIAKGVNQLFVIFPTGHGKTKNILIPIKLKGARVTIVISPLISLADNLYEECKQINIDCIRFGKGPARMANVVIVTAEVAMGKEFTHYANEIKQMGKLDRIVWDEVHKWETDTYRPKLREANHWCLGVQEVYLTATWPRYLQTRFLRRWKIQDPTIIRIPNKKPKVRYTVSVFEDEEFE